MENDYNVLYHHGILGMKWGRRRYQNPDGTLTELGKKRATKLESKYQKLTGNNIKDKTKHTTVKLSQLSNEEIRNITNRLNVESDYLNAVNRRSSFNPKPKEKKGRAFIKKLGSKIVYPVFKDAAINNGKKYVNKLLDDIMNDGKLPKKTIEEEVRELNLKKQKVEAITAIEKFNKAHPKKK